MNTPLTPGVRVEPIAGAISIEICREPILPNAEQEHQIERAWQELCAHNPRYFNGRILSFESFDQSRSVATARDVEYRLHAVRETVDSGIAFFGVTGLLRCDRRYLVGRRAASVHEYPGQWEFAPCGGIDPPPAGQDTLSPSQIANELFREASEELGIELAGIEPRPLALVHDDPVGSTDLMMLIELGSLPGSAKNWEYSETRWLAIDEIAELHRSGEGTVIPTTRAMLEHLRSMPGQE